jgi:glycosyltransferase involved in cell wall biosynthesis
MACGNAIIAADVGQTSQFVRHEENGFLVRQETAEAFAEALATYLRQPEHHELFAKASRALVTDVHTVENAVGDLISFWRQVLSSEPPASPEDRQPFAS